jgi:hypothetical protein
MKTTLLLLPMAVLAACTTPTTLTSPAPLKGKPTAPVAVTAQLSRGAARVQVTFEADAQQVEIAASGVDGLTVTGPAVLLEQGSFARGAQTTYDVPFTPGPGRSTLVVSVSGVFNGGSRARVAAFTVGEGPLAPSPGTVMTTDDGTTVKVLPAGEPATGH